MRVLLSSLLLLLICFGVVRAANLNVNSAAVISGTASNQPLSALATQDQSGTADNWDKYIEYSSTFSGMEMDILIHYLS